MRHIYRPSVESVHNTRHSFLWLGIKGLTRTEKERKVRIIKDLTTQKKHTLFLARKKLKSTFFCGFFPLRGGGRFSADIMFQIMFDRPFLLCLQMWKLIQELLGSRKVHKRDIFIDLINVPTFSVISPGITRKMSEIVCLIKLFVNWLSVLMPKHWHIWSVSVRKLLKVRYVFVLLMVYLLAKLLNLLLKSRPFYHPHITLQN